MRNSRLALTYPARHPALVATMAALIGSSALAVRPARADSDALRLEDAVARALARHPAIKATDRGVDVAEARVAEAQSAWLPRLVAVGAYRYSSPLPKFSMSIDVPGAPAPLEIERFVGSNSTASVALQAGWRALDFGARDARTDAARQAATAARAEGAERAVDLAYAVRGSYLAILLHQEIAASTERSLETARAVLAEQRVQRQAGIGNDLAVASAESRVADLEARLVEVRENRARAATDLGIMLGLPDGGSLVLSDRLAELAIPTVAGSQHPTLQRLAALEAAADLQRDAVGRARLPTVDVYGQVAYQYPRDFLSTGGSDFAYLAGVTVTWDAFDGDLRRRQRRELAAQRSQALALREAAAEDIARRDAAARASQESASAAISSAERALGAAEVYEQAARAAMNAGTGTTLEHQTAADAVDRARLVVVKARFDAALAHADRLRAAGIAVLPTAGVAAMGSKENP